MSGSRRIARAYNDRMTPNSSDLIEPLIARIATRVARGLDQQRTAARQRAITEREIQ
jgi:hypothetical protein